MLVGQPASSFSVAAAPLRATPPPVPLGVPSDVLERRPDIATAERQIAYANAQVGIARAAFYPHITLGGSGGWQSRDIATLANAPSLFWSLGADALEPIFQGGRNRANLAAARRPMTPLWPTTGSLCWPPSSRWRTASATCKPSRRRPPRRPRPSKMPAASWLSPITATSPELPTYLDVITAQSTLLANERLATQLLGQQMVSSVYLVKALGGGWDASELNQQQVHPQAIQIVQP